MNRAAKHEFDVVVLGAALGGVMSAALLAKRGYRVALFEALDQAGGRSGGTEYNGYWIDWGHRDGHGYGAGLDLDLQPRRQGSCGGGSDQ